MLTLILTGLASGAIGVWIGLMIRRPALAQPVSVPFHPASAPFQVVSVPVRATLPVRSAQVSLSEPLAIPSHTGPPRYRVTTRNGQVALYDGYDGSTALRAYEFGHADGVVFVQIDEQGLHMRGTRGTRS